MARIRSIKPEFFTDEKIGQLSETARLLFIGLWCFADDEGRYIGSEQVICGAIFPFSRDSVNIHGALSELSRTGRIVLYEVDGNKYLEIVHFKRHQKINRPSKSRLPGPFSEGSVSTHGALLKNIGADLGSVGSRIIPPLGGEKRQKTKGPPNPRLRILTEKLCGLYQEITHSKYGHRGAKDAEAVKRLLGFSDDDDEHLRRYRKTLEAEGYLHCDTFTEFADKWNKFVTLPGLEWPEEFKGYDNAK